MNLRKNLEYLLKINKMSKSDLARQLNITRQSIDTLINTKDPRISTCIRLCTIFNVTLDDLIVKDLTI